MQLQEAEKPEPRAVCPVCREVFLSVYHAVDHGRATGHGWTPEQKQEDKPAVETQQPWRYYA